MPIYEYRCPNCGHKFERLMRMGADAPTCPQCGAAKSNRLLSAFAKPIMGGDGCGAPNCGMLTGG